MISFKSLKKVIILSFPPINWAYIFRNIRLPVYADDTKGYKLPEVLVDQDKLILHYQTYCLVEIIVELQAVFFRS